MRLKYLRKELKITQTQLGETIHQSKSNISKYERGTLEPNIQTIIELSRFFNVSVDYLLEVSDIRNPYMIAEEKIDELIAHADLLYKKLIMLKKGIDT